MRKFSKYQFTIVSEIFMVLALSLIGFALAEFIKSGLVSNYYDINIHFIITLFFLIVVLVYPREE